MNEQDFRNALRQTMAVSTAPPPMRDDEVLDAARRDRKRRRAMWAGGGSAVAVAAIAVGVVVLAPSGSGGGVDVGGQPPEVQSTQEPPPTTGGAQDQDTKTSWPNGQTDRTATAGPQFDKGVEVADALAGVIPAGYESPDDLEGGDAASGKYPLKSHQAQFAAYGPDGKTELWEYSATAPVTKDNGVGLMAVTVRTPGSATGDGCAMVQVPGCVETVVDGKKVGVVDASTTDGSTEQSAFYRHEDGTVVTVTQSAAYSHVDMPALAGMPLTADQLAALAVDPRFKLD